MSVAANLRNEAAIELVKKSLLDENDKAFIISEFEGFALSKSITPESDYINLTRVHVSINLSSYVVKPEIEELVKLNKKAKLKLRVFNAINMLPSETLRKNMLYKINQLLPLDLIAYQRLLNDEADFLNNLDEVSELARKRCLVLGILSDLGQMSDKSFYDILAKLKLISEEIEYAYTVFRAGKILLTGLEVYGVFFEKGNF